MKRINLTIAFDDEKMDALEFSLRKENTTVQERMDDALAKLYERSVPEAVREYLDSKASPAKEKTKRPAKTVAVQKDRASQQESKPAVSKPPISEQKPATPVQGQPSHHHP